MSINPHKRRRNQVPILFTEVASGFMAGSVSKTLVAPLERVKLLLQNQALIHADKARYKGIFDALVRVASEQGFFAFWRGNGTNILRIIPNSAIRFSSYEYFNKIFLPRGNNSYNNMDRGVRKIGAASLSGLLTIAFTYPLDLVRTRLALDVSKFAEPREYQGTLGCMKKIAKAEGISGLYKGFWISCVGIVPYLALSLSTYDLLKPFLFDINLMESESIGSVVLNYLGAGTIAGMTAQILTYPLDTIRRRMQLNGGHGLQKAYRSSFDCLKKIVMTEGVKGFYRGMIPNLVKIPPAAAIQFSLYDLFRYQVMENK